MRNRLGRLGLMTMAAVLAVGLCGAAFASWTDDLVVQGVVETGEVDLVIEDTSETWVYKDLSSREMVVLEEESDNPDYLEVAKAYVSSYDVETDVASVAFENVFPGPEFKADLKVHYYGVPGHVSVLSFNVAPAELVPYMWWEIVWPDDTTSTGSAMDATLMFIEDEYQLHECETFTVNIYCQIPQDMTLRDISGTVFMQLEAKQWNECEPELQKVLDLPDEKVHLKVVGTYSPTKDSYGKPRSYFDAYITNVPPGYGWLEAGNPWPAWCCEFENSAVTELDVTLVSTIGMVQWEPINYLLNQSGYLAPPYNYDGLNMTVGGFSGVKTHSARQRAYWSYQPGGWSPPAGDKALDLIADANLNSAGFVPAPGQLAAVICQDGTSYQTVFIEVDP